MYSKDIKKIILQYLKNDKFHMQYIIKTTFISTELPILNPSPSILKSSHIKDEFVYLTSLSKYRYRKYYHYDFIILL